VVLTLKALAIKPSPLQKIFELNRLARLFNFSLQSKIRKPYFTNLLDMPEYEELKYLKKYNMTEEQKIKLIQNLYRLAYINFNNFIKNN